MQASVRGSDFVFDSVQLFYCKCRKINFKRGGSYIDSPDWIKKAVINEKNEVDKYFKYVLTVALNYRKVKWNWDRVSNIKTFINNYNWKVINHLTKIDHWKTFAKNNPTIAPNILHIKEKEICSAYISKQNSACEKNNSLNDSKWRRIMKMALSCSKVIICIIKQNNFKNKSDFYCLNCFCSFITKNKFKSHEKVCNVIRKV